MQKLPEAIRMSGKMMAGLGRAQAWIDPDEQHPHTGLNAVTKGRVS
jgi:hypothetical protein